jgi:hypothetical protein
VSPRSLFIVAVGLNSSIDSVHHAAYETQEEAERAARAMAARYLERYPDATARERIGRRGMLELEVRLPADADGRTGRVKIEILVRHDGEHAAPVAA